ncbi:MAG: OmpH family outer membrane protein [Flavobacteriales bacterium]|nr:OmpH family outer membrane protein [Flavobacteriales bacterium]
MRNLFIAVLILTMAPLASMAQKIAYADVSAILSVMPENEKINEDLKIYATGLQRPLEDMKARLDAYTEQFQKVLAAKDTAKALEIQKQAIEEDKKFQEAAQKAEQQLAQKKNESLLPVLTRIKEAMKAVADKEGFEYVLNSVDGAGTSIVLVGPEGHDITRKVVDELGIDLKQQGNAGGQSAPPENTGKRNKK